MCYLGGSMRICILSEPTDLSSIYIRQLAKNRGIEVVELRENLLGTGWTFKFDDQNIGEGLIELENKSLKFSDINGVFVRFDSEPVLPKGLDLALKDKEFFLAERRAALEYLLNILPIEVANRPCSGWSNGSKPFQMRLLEKVGFNVPNWIATNQEKVAKEFALNCADGAVYKSCSGLRSRVRRLNVNVLRRLRVGTTPFIVQEYIKGRDVRVHVVKSKVFATEVISKNVDYRFDTNDVELRATSLPIRISDLCCKVVGEEGFVVGGFDFRVSENEKWFCLELNPVPTFIYYEMITGQPIGKTLLDAITKS